MEPYLNPETGKGWTPEEEIVITNIMGEQSCDRMEAIRAARRRWIIGETRPPGWPEGRRMPKSNPWYVQGASQDGSKSGQPAENVHGLFVAGLAIASDANPPRKRGRPPVSDEWKRDMANGRKARWRAKKQIAAAQPVEQAA
jgi:hypothetical protein